MYGETFTVDEEVNCTVDTNKAILVNVDGEDHWVPKSQIDAASECFEAGTSGSLIVTQWFAEKAGWA